MLKTTKMLALAAFISIPLSTFPQKSAQAFGFFVFSFPALQGPEFPSTELEISVDTSVSDSALEDPNIGIFQDAISSFSYKESQDNSFFDPNDPLVVVRDIQTVKSITSAPGEAFTLKSTFSGDTLIYNFIKDSDNPNELITDFSGKPLSLNVNFLAITDVISGGARILTEPRTLTDVQKERVVNSLDFYNNIIIQSSTFEGSILEDSLFFDPEETEGLEFRNNVLGGIDQIPLALIVEIAEGIEPDEFGGPGIEGKLIRNLVQVDPQNPPAAVPTPSMLPGLLLSAIQFLKTRKARLAKSAL